MLLAVGVGALLTPYGIFSALVTLELFNMKFLVQRIAEWKSPDFQAYQPLLFLLVGLFASNHRIGNSIARSEINRIQHDDVSGLEPYSRAPDVFLGCANYSCASDCVPFCLVACYSRC